MSFFQSREEEEPDDYAFPLTLKDPRRATPPAASPVIGLTNGGI